MLLFNMLQNQEPFTNVYWHAFSTFQVHLAMIIRFVTHQVSGMFIVYKMYQLKRNSIYIDHLERIHDKYQNDVADTSCDLISCNITVYLSSSLYVWRFSIIEGILPKGPYPPCLRMAVRALLAGYPRIIVLCVLCSVSFHPLVTGSTCVMWGYGNKELEFHF